MTIKLINQQSSESFLNWKVIAQIEQSHIRLVINPLDSLETFPEMFKKRYPTDPNKIKHALINEGFSLANLGISIALEVISPWGEKFAVFTRRGYDKKCLALISGYWDAYNDTNLSSCALRELSEEFLVYLNIDDKFLVSKEFLFPYQELSWHYSDLFRIYSRYDALNWVRSAKLKAFGDECRVYIDATTSSAQAVYGYCVEFVDWSNLSILHAEDHSEANGQLVTFLEDESIVLFRILNNQLVGAPYALKQGHLMPISLPEDSYFHSSMVGADQWGIVISDYIPLREVIKDLYF